VGISCFSEILSSFCHISGTVSYELGIFFSVGF
jgi:hypothetical protein